MILKITTNPTKRSSSTNPYRKTNKFREKGRAFIGFIAGAAGAAEPAFLACFIAFMGLDMVAKSDGENDLQNV